MEVLEGFPNCSTKNLNKEPSHLAFFTALDPTEYWGNDKRVGVPVFTNRKIKTTKSKTRQSDPESLSEKTTSY